MSQISEKLFTIVIPVFNRETIVLRTLNSIEEQIARNFRLVLVDNVSTDNSLAVITRWAEDQQHSERPIEVTVLSEPKPGACAARNRGLSVVDTPWVMFFDSDDLMLPDHTLRVQEAIEAHPQARIVGWDVDHRRLDGTTIQRYFRIKSPQFHNLFHGSFATQRYACLTQLMRSVGAWDESVMAWNDIELGNRLLLGSPKMVKLKGIKNTVVVVATPDSITGTCFHTRASRFDHSVDKIKHNLPDRLKHYAEIKRAILAGKCTREGDSITGEALYKKALENTSSTYNRVLIKCAYRYTAIGGRGAARLLKPFM